MSLQVESTTEELRRKAAAHLWPQFGGDRRSRAGELPIIERGEGCRVWDTDGREYLDGLSALFCVNLGHGREDIVDAGVRAARRLGYFSTWGYAHRPAVELAARIAELAPCDLERVFFTSGGSEAVESALKLARQYHRALGRPAKAKVIAREYAYHGTTMGALSLTGVPALRQPYEPLLPGACHVPATDLSRLPAGTDPLALAEAIRERIVFEGPDSVAAVILEPVQNGGGCLPPPPGYFERVREICDEHDVLLIADEAVCAWGRLGEWFGAQRYGFEPDVVVTAKGLASGYAPIGAMIVSRQIAAVAFEERDEPFLHGFTFGGHPLAAGIAHAAIDALDAEGVLPHVRAHERELCEALHRLRDLPVVGDVRGAGYLWGVELLRDRDSHAPFAPAERRGVAAALTDDLLGRGLICRVNDRGPLVLQLAPPLIAGPAEFERIETTVRAALELLSRRR